MSSLAPQLSSNNAALNYNDNTIAAALIYADLVNNGREQLRRFNQITPSGTEATIYFQIAGNLNIEGFNAPQAPSFNHTATIILHNGEDRRLNLSVQVSPFTQPTYQPERDFTDRIGIMPNNALPTPQSRTFVLVEGSAEEAVPREREESGIIRYPLPTDEGDMPFLLKREEGRSDSNIKEAIEVTKLIYQSFQSGIPMPFERGVEMSSLKVKVTVPSESVQEVKIMRGMKIEQAYEDSSYSGASEEVRQVNLHIKSHEKGEVSFTFSQLPNPERRWTSPSEASIESFGRSHQLNVVHFIRPDTTASNEF